ncbi:MAG: TIGR02300 family protein [Alphaproteobacteria bacterium]
MSAALDVRGLKRVCVSCGIRFYDLNKRPIHCPNCQTEFSGEIKLKGRRGRVAAVEVEEVIKAKVVPVANDDQSTDVEAREEGIVSLEDVEALENAGADEDGDEIEVEDDDIGSLEEIEEDAALDVPVDKKKE